jgi:hypothetical protein
MTAKGDFASLEERWLVVAAGYKFSERLASRIADLDVQKRNVRAIAYWGRGVGCVGDAGAIAIR